MKTIVTSELFAARRRLDGLNIEMAAVVEAVRAGSLNRHSCTELDPRMFPGSAMWAVTIRHLRLGLIPRGWSFSESGNFSRTISPGGSLVIVVATGDEATGVPERSPTTQSRKGPRTVEVVASNAYQLDFPFEWPDNQQPNSENADATTWLLLVHYGGNQVRAELSRPISFDDTFRVSGWHERIILPAIDIEPDDTFDFGPDESPDIDVPVRRRQ